MTELVLFTMRFTVDCLYKVGPIVFMSLGTSLRSLASGILSENWVFFAELYTHEKSHF